MADLFSHQISDIVAAVLKSLGLGVLRGETGAWPISINSEESSPDNVITVYDTEARPDGRVQPTGEQLSHPAVQIRIRARTQRTAFLKAKDIAYNLDRVVYHTSVTIDGSTYCVQSISRSPSLNYIGKETTSTQRDLYTINAYVVAYQTV